MVEIIDPRRAAVIAEARSWLGTPFAEGQQLKGAGVDCGRFPLAVYAAAGLIAPFAPGYFAPQFSLHSDDEPYLRLVERYARRVEHPLPGDFAMWRWGRAFGHGAIVTAWPMVIHAWGLAATRDRPEGQVIEMSAEEPRLRLLGRSGAPREVRFFSPFAP